MQSDEQDEVIIFRVDEITGVRPDVRDIYGSRVLGKLVPRRVAKRLLPAAGRTIEQGRTTIVHVGPR